MVVTLVFLFISVFLFCREIRLESKQRKRREELGDAHIMKEINRFLKERGLKELE
jgi:hypothetical protein